MNRIQYFNISPKYIIPPLILLAVYIIYGEFIWNPIIFDDAVLFQIGSEGFNHYSFNIFDIRAIPYASITLTAKYFGFNIVNFRLTSLALHSGVGIALFYFLKNIYSLTWRGSPTHYHHENWLQWTAFFSALMFVWHPVAVYGAGYLIQRTIVMATLFSLLALNSYLIGITTNKKSWLFISVFLYGLALLCKEHAVMLPLVMACLSILFRKISLISRKSLAFVFCSYLMIASYAILIKLGILGKVYEFTASGMISSANITANPYPLSIITQSWLYFKYLWLWIIPSPSWLSIDMREEFAPQIFSYYLFGALLYILYGLGAFWLLLQQGKKGLLGFALLFPWLLFMTEFSSVRIQEPFVLYRSYLWMTGIFCAIPLIMIKRNFRLNVVILILISLLFAAGTTDRLLTFATPTLLWADAEKLVHDKPNILGASRIYYNLGAEKIKFKAYSSALKDFKVAIDLNPDFALFHFGAANAYYGLSDFKNAAEEYTKSIILKDDDPNAHYWRAVCYKKMDMMIDAQKDFYLSCKMGLSKSCGEVNH